jgi:hypothetical protein
LEELRGAVRFDWDAMSEWLEEDEPVYTHPRDPYHRIDILNSSRHVEVRVEGITVADSHQPRILFETSLPPRYYLPLTDVRLDEVEAGTQRLDQAAVADTGRPNTRQDVQIRHEANRLDAVFRTAITDPLGQRQFLHGATKRADRPQDRSHRRRPHQRAILGQGGTHHPWYHHDQIIDQHLPCCPPFHSAPPGPRQYRVDAAPTPPLPSVWG